MSVFDWQLFVPLAIAAGFVWERTRNIAYARQFGVPSQFVSVDPRQALVTLDRYILPALVAGVCVVVLQIVLSRDRGTTDADRRGPWVRSAHRLSDLWSGTPKGAVRFLVAILLLVFVALAGSNAGRQDARDQASFFVLESSGDPDTVTVVVYISGDTLVVREARKRHDKPASYRFEPGFTVRKLDATPVLLIRRPLGRIAPAT